MRTDERQGRATSRVPVALVAAGMAAAVLLGACGSDDNSNGAAGGAKTPQASSSPTTGGPLAYTAVEYGWQGPTTVPAGKVPLSLENGGKQHHELLVIQLLQGKTIDDVKALLEKQGAGGKPPPWAKIAGGVKPTKPGASGTGGAEFQAGGTYIYACFVPDEKDHKPHALHGMLEEVTVQ